MILDRIPNGLGVLGVLLKLRSRAVKEGGVQGQSVVKAQKMPGMLLYPVYKSRKLGGYVTSCRQFWR